LFTVCVPYARPMAENISLEELVRNAAPNLSYQLQFKSGEVERVIRSKGDIRQFLLALYGGRTEGGEVAFDAHKGVLVDKIGGLKPSKLLSEEVGLALFLVVVGGFADLVQELEFYADEFARSGIHGPRMYFREVDGLC
jgi:hypothetical protein